MKLIESYSSVTSLKPGEKIEFHINTKEICNIKIEIYRYGNQQTCLFSTIGSAQNYETPENAYAVGCNWKSAFSLVVPNEWKSGVYFAQITELIEGSNEIVYFVVKTSKPGSNSKILLQLPVTTSQAYNAWGGKSLYNFNSSDKIRSTVVSFDRPSPFFQYETDLIDWLEAKDYEIEWCSSIDLHQDSELLSNYNLLICVGHDEYWSKEMRDNVEYFIGEGGNVAFFSGNTCWWQVRFEDNCRRMICHKDKNSDPLFQLDNDRVTVNWYAQPVSRPENYMTGVGSQHGGGQKNENHKTRYKIQCSRHWVFEGTGLEDGDEFGLYMANNNTFSIIGYEADAASFEFNQLPWKTDGLDGSPNNFIILGCAKLSENDWNPTNDSLDDCSNRKSLLLATMGIFRNKGFVFTSGTVSWAKGLKVEGSEVEIITQNVLNKLSKPRAQFQFVPLNVMRG